MRVVVNKTVTWTITLFWTQKESIFVWSQTPSTTWYLTTGVPFLSLDESTSLLKFGFGDSYEGVPLFFSYL